MQIDIHFLALLCGHFLGDFVLQTDGLVQRKAKQARWLLCHVLLVSVLTWILLGTLDAWWLVIFVFVLHLLVDYIKLKIVNNRQTKSDHDFLLFIGDQALHILFTVLLWTWLSRSGTGASLTNHWVEIWGADYAKSLLLLTGLAVGVSGVGIVLMHQMTGFASELADKVKQGLPKGGKTIGTLERLLVFMFVLAGRPEGIGFVIAAKSVFRIGELTNREDRNHAEYIMIGTLRSFTYALVVAFITRWLMTQIE